jgi:excisionase family DNA binding protein
VVYRFGSGKKKKRQTKNQTCEKKIIRAWYSYQLLQAGVLMANESSTITRLLSVSDAAKYLAICERNLFELTKTKKLPAVRIGRAVRYDLNDLDGFITKAKNEGL